MKFGHPRSLEQTYGENRDIKNSPLGVLDKEQVMDTKLLRESKRYREAAKKIFKEVETLLGKAQISADLAEQYKLYLQAMEMSNKAYNLMAKAKELKKKHIRVQQEELERQRILY
jgi:hypothetical protein